MQNEKKGITVKIDAELHAEVKAYLEEHNMTMAEFVTAALQDELHPKNNLSEDNNMNNENMRTLAFQVPESLFQRIKDYLRRNNISQKQFVLGLIQNELDRDQTARQAQNARDEQVEDVDEEQDETATEAVLEGEDGESEDEDEELDEDEESEEELTEETTLTDDNLPDEIEEDEDEELDEDAPSEDDTDEDEELDEDEESEDEELSEGEEETQGFGMTM